MNMGTRGFGDGVSFTSFTGDNGRATTMAGGGAFLEPFMVGSFPRFDVVVTLCTVRVFLITEYRLLEELGTLKFVDVVAVDPYVECRYILGMGGDSGIDSGSVCIDRLLSLIARAFGLGLFSSAEIFGVISSKVVELLSRVGERSGDEVRSVTNVLCPDDIYEYLLLPLLRSSSWRPS